MAGLFNYCRVFMKAAAAVLKQIQANIQSLRFRGKHLFWQIKQLATIFLDFFSYILWNKSMNIIIADAILKYVPLQFESLRQFLFMQFLKTEALEKFNSNNRKIVLFPKWTRDMWNQRDLKSVRDRGRYQFVIQKPKNRSGGDGREICGHKHLQ